MTDPQASPRQPASTARPHWGAEALWQALVPLLPGLSIEVVQTLDSTNSELTDRLRNAGRVQQDRLGVGAAQAIGQSLAGDGVAGASLVLPYGDHGNRSTSLEGNDLGSDY